MHKDLKIYYIVNARIPTEKAHGFAICKLCEELSFLGAEIELIAPNKKNNTQEDTFSFYGLENNFRINFLKSFDFMAYEKYLGGLSFRLSGFFFLARLFLKKINPEAVVYSRDPEICWLFHLKGNKVFFEAHRWPEKNRRLLKFFFKKNNGLVCNSQGTAKKYIEAGFKNILVAPNGVDLKKFGIKNDPNAVRLEFGLPLDKKIIMYIGHLYKWKGVDVVLAAAKKEADNKNIFFAIVGGTELDIAQYQRKIKEERLNNIGLFGHQATKNIPKLLQAADILLLPNIPASSESTEYTSPIKMFEYMAAGRPIIASDLPSIREILNDKNAIFFRPGDARDLAEKISHVIAGRIDANKIFEQAKNDVENYSWEKRARKILEFIKN